MDERNKGFIEPTVHRIANAPGNPRHYLEIIGGLYKVLWLGQQALVPHPIGLFTNKAFIEVSPSGQQGLS